MKQLQAKYFGLVAPLAVFYAQTPRLMRLLTGTIVDWVCGLQDLLSIIAGAFAVIGILGLGLMYLGSSIPLMSEWKKNNPKAFRDVTWGLIFIVFATSGAALTLTGSDETC